MGFEEAFYEKKNLDPKMRALLNSLAKTDHTLANEIEAPHKILRKNPVQYMNMSRIFLFTTIFFIVFPLIIRKIFHCNDFSYPPSPWTIHKILCHIAGSQQFSHGQAQTDTIHPLFVNESGYSHFHCHYQSVSKCLLLSSSSHLPVSGCWNFSL